eukprot:c15816_g1_i1.p1 GENE.c15816_g1_i1~~c15816_g1_i1.p1  ORF type:complete len:445 (+),score=72.18 c15816_g1_i1:53-1387(+)
MIAGGFAEEQLGANLYGPLHKALGVMSKYWAMRYCLLKACHIMCYKSIEDTKPQDVIQLQGSKVIRFCRSDSNLNGFFIIHPHELRPHILLAQSEADAHRWTKAVVQITINIAPRPKRSIGSAPNFSRVVSCATNRIEDLYIVHEVLGRGGFSVVHRGVCRADLSEVALKLIPLSSECSSRTDDEVRLLAALDHPGIVKLKQVVRTSSHLVICMEHLKGGELFDRIVSRTKFNENDAKMIAVRMLEAVRYLHEHHICHRDLKPENLLFDHPGDDANLKLTDFGLAMLVSSTPKTQTACGSPEYVAPEVLCEEPCGTAVDMWGCGVIVYILLCGFPPFYASSQQQLFENICAARYEFISPHWDKVSIEAKDLISRLLELDPTKRLTANEAMDHPWLSKEAIDFENDLTGVVSHLQRFNVTRKFRKGVLAVLAANKLSKAFPLPLA